MIEALRQRMVAAKIDAYLVPSFDPHQSEYVPEHFKLRQALTGFTGSAGFALVTQTEALLWTDGRYFTQAESELSTGPFKLMKLGIPGEPSLSQWLCAHLPKGSVVGLDGKCYSQQALKLLQHETADRDFNFKIDTCLLEGLWEGRPALPSAEAFELPDAYAGTSRSTKLNRLRTLLTDQGADMGVFTGLDDIAWLLNLRGEDVTYCPFVLSYVMVSQNEVNLYIHLDKVSEPLNRRLNEAGVVCKAYEQFYADLRAIQSVKVLAEPSVANALVFEALTLKGLERQVQVIEAKDTIGLMKAVKSPEEMRHIRDSQIADGVAMVKFLYWLENAMLASANASSAPGTSVTELTVASQLEAFRREHPLSLGASFNTIAAYGKNAAMMHYSATETHYSQLEPQGFLLFDSGGQYYNGTTDITRTVALGPLTDEERLDYTLTLKAHIGLARAVFLEGTCGPHLDILARQAMWEQGLDYKCGTGHGIGYVLSVHEGPHTIRCNQNDVPLKPGMLLTNEPGVYKPGRHGVRIENTMVVSPLRQTEFGQFYHFETISWCPIDTRPLVKEQLTAHEIKWLNDYHQQVRAALSPYFNEELKSFLSELTETF